MWILEARKVQLPHRATATCAACSKCRRFMQARRRQLEEENRRLEEERLLGELAVLRWCTLQIWNPNPGRGDGLV